MRYLENFFYPKTVCIAGASSKPKSIGYELTKNIIDYGFTGEIFPVNPKADEILGLKNYKSISEISSTIDLAIILVPKQFVTETLNELVLKKVKSVILITAGFREVGEEGKRAEQEILKICKLNNISLVGPNCMGVISTIPSVKLNATFVAEKPESGATGFFSQSGALGAAVLNSLRETDIKFAHFISAGNKADINENDILEYWLEDSNIKTLTFYLESFVNGESFTKTVVKNKLKKPIIVLKSGKSESGMKAAGSHTGAIGSRDKVVNAMLNQYGIVRVDDVNEMFNTSKGFENFPIPCGNKIAIVTNAGGPAILATDSLEKENLLLAELSEETKNRLREIVHPEGSVNNPVDLLPGGTGEIYKQVNKILTEDKNVDAVISIFVEPVMINPLTVVDEVNSIESDKPIFQVEMPVPEFWEKYKTQSKYNTPVFRHPEEPSKIISNMLFFKEKRDIHNHIDLNANFIEPKRMLETDSDNGFLNHTEIENLVFLYDLPYVASKTISYNDSEMFHQVNFPCVIKGISSNVVHKSELNAVKINIKTFDELISAAGEIELNFKRYGFEIEEFLIQPYIKAKHEILIGGFRDNSFGPFIMFGSGGKYVEVLCDTSIKSAYLNSDDIDEMIKSTKIGTILSGVRGEHPFDLAELKKIIKNSARMMAECPNIKEFDINPLLLTEENNFYAVDIRIKI